MIFKDYGNREISIAHADYLELIASPHRRAIRPALEEALLNPTEVYVLLEKIGDDICHSYRYLKFYKNLVFVAIVTVEKGFLFELNNFYGYNENEFDEVENERRGNRVVGN